MECHPDSARGVSESPQTIERNRNRRAMLSTNSRTPLSETQTSTPSQTRCEPEGSTQSSNEHSLVELPSSGQLFPSPSSNTLVTRPLPRKNSPRVGDTDTSERDARKKIQKEKRMDLQLKKRKQNLRENIARELDRDVASIDSDEERKFVKRIFENIDAEEKRRQGLSPAERRREDIQSSARALGELVKAYFGPYSRRPYAAFLLQEAPESRRGAKCQLHHCEKSIWPGDYRIKVDDGKQWSDFPSGFYHIECFEELLDLSSPAYASRFEPDMQYFPGCMELCILQEYVRRWMIRVGVQEPTFPEHLWGTFANEKNSERYFVSETDPNYDERHSLSSALRNWQQKVSETGE